MSHPIRKGFFCATTGRGNDTAAEAIKATKSRRRMVFHPNPRATWQPKYSTSATSALAFFKRPMSALGQKQTYAMQNGMSALPPKADMCGALAHVPYGPIADIISFDHFVGGDNQAGGRGQP